MNGERSSKHKFDKNLLALSCSQDVEGAKQEGRTGWRESRKESDGLCLCQHRIKHIVYLYNKKTKKTISVGCECYKKFNFDAREMSNYMLQYVMREVLSKGEYARIDNVIEFSESIKDRLPGVIWRGYENVKYRKDERYRFLNEVEDLVESYGIDYLAVAYDEMKEDSDKLDRADEIIRQTEQAKLDRINEIKMKKQDRMIEMDERLNRLSGLLDKGIEEETYLQEGDVCSRCHKPDKYGKLYQLRAPSGTLKFYRCQECSRLADHWIDTKFSDRAFAS